MNLKNTIALITLALFVGNAALQAQQPDGTLYTFKFVPKRSALFEYADNSGAEYDKLYRAIDKYRADIVKGSVLIYVDGYCLQFNSEGENLATAKMMTEHIQHNLMITKNLESKYFVISNTAAKNGADMSVTVVSLKINKDYVDPVVVKPVVVVEEIQSEPQPVVVEEPAPIIETPKRREFDYLVAGKVIDAATKKPIAGANLDIPGVASAISNDDGSYTLALPDPEAILVVRAYGYQQQEIGLRKRKTLNIALYDENYKSVQMSIFTPTSDISSINTPYSWYGIEEDNILTTAVTPDLLLKASASGMNVDVRSGLPTVGSNFYLHGLNTMNAGTMPLFVVDGMPLENSQYSSSMFGNYYDNPLASIDPKDIKSITVLKDGSSLYGTKAANGVVLIKTVRADVLETTINVHAHAGMSFVPVEMPVLNGVEHKSYLAELYADRYAGVDINTLNKAFPFLNSEIPVKQPWGYQGNVDYYRYNHNTNWQREIFVPTYMQDYYLNVAGGDEIAKYVLSLGYLSQQGLIKGTDLQRFNTRFNSEIKFSQKFKVLSNMSFVYGDKQHANEGADLQRNPILSALTKSPATAPFIFNAEGKESPNVENADYWNLSNPYVLANSLANKLLLQNINYRFFGSFEFIYDINKYWQVGAMTGLNFYRSSERIFYPSKGIAFDDLIVTNSAEQASSRLFALYGNIYGDYKNTFAEQHALNLRVGTRYQSNQGEYDWGRAFNSSSDDFKSLQYGVNSYRQKGGSLSRWNWWSVYANADYAFRQRYILNVSTAADASSRYGTKTSDFRIFPSVGAAWLISNESFMRALPAVNMFKLRASYGSTGNDDMGNYNNRKSYIAENFLGQWGMRPTTIENKNLRPETVERLNAGFDMSLLNQRVSVSFDLYQNTTRDMILNITPDVMTGLDAYISNAGAMRNRGFDIAINARLINGAAFKWDMGLQLSHYKNEVLELGGKSEYLTEVLGATVQTKVGQPLGVFYGYQTEGVYATSAEAQAAGLYIQKGIVNYPFAAGDVKFVNQNPADGKLISDADRVVIGDPNPDFFGNISNTFSYKGITLNALFTCKIGGDVYNWTRSQMESVSMPYNQFQSVLGRWRKEGDIASIPRASWGDPMGNARFSDRWIEDGSYVRLKTLTLSYDFAQAKVQLPWVENLVVFVTGENLLTFTKYTGLDPEFSMGTNPLYQGIDPCVTPQPRTLSLGVKLNL